MPPNPTHTQIMEIWVHELPCGDISALALDLKLPLSPTPEPRLQAHSGVVGGYLQQGLNINAAGLDVELESPVMERRVRMIVQHPPTLCS